VLVVGQQASDGAGGVVEDLATAEVTSKTAPVLQVPDAVFDTHTPLVVCFPLCCADFSDTWHAFHGFLVVFCVGVMTCPAVCALRPW
jgi:hypothetical protein